MSNPADSERVCIDTQKFAMDLVLTFIPHLKGVTDVPTTGSWLIAMISLFLRMLSISGLTLESYL